MSYFVCGYKIEGMDIDVLGELMFDVVPAEKRHTSLKLQGACSHFVNYATEKVIPDIVLKKNDSDSWLTAVGTPLLRFKDKKEELAFFDGFLVSPGDFLRHKIDGNFALFCYDSKRDRFIAATDFNNTIPIFYSVTMNGVYFSSHELVLAKFLNAELDPVGFAQSMHLGVAWGSQTRFKRIFKMLPCQELVVDAKKKAFTECYWRPEEETIPSCGFDEFVAKYISSLSESIRKFYKCGDFRPLASDLTGGEDARLLVAQCHALKIPYKVQVVGSDNDSDVIIAKQAAMKTGIDLIVRKREWITGEELLANAPAIILNKDAHQDLVDACIEWATNKENPLDDYKTVVFCGVPGGVAFRGQYYLRGKAFFPSTRSSLDYKFFTRLKYLLDYYPGLLAYPDDKFRESVYRMVHDSLIEVEGFPLGTQIDHLLRVFGTCLFGTKYKNPLYLPSAVRDLTRSVYYIPPRYKQGGRLTRACTEILFPELAFVKTQKGVPTVRMTPTRIHLFIPEYYHLMGSIRRGVLTRLLKWKQPRPLLSMDKNAYIFTTILNNEPYNDWFASSKSMVTGNLYNEDVVNSILAQAKTGSCKNVPILGRIINAELACRWVYRKGL